MSAPRKQLIPGSTFGQWQVVALLESKRIGKTTMSMYECKCSCGTTRSIQRGNLVSGQTHSCGCIGARKTADRMKKEPGFAATTSVLGYYQRNAKKRGIIWDLTREQFETFMHAPCHYCGALKSMTFTKHKDTVSYNGVDRSDPDKDYVPPNCVSCCKACNTAKASMTVDEFLAWVDRVHSHSCH